jgi:hypothetical protein
MDPTLTDDEQRFMLWLELEDDVVGHDAGELSDLPPSWQHMKQEVTVLGDMLRTHFPRNSVLPDPTAFNNSIQHRL